MNGHGTITPADRKTGIDDVRREIQGKAPRGPFEFSSDDDLKFSDIDPKDDDPVAKRAFLQALKRDAMYSSAGPVYLRAFGLSQAMRELYAGSKQLIDGGLA